MSPLTLEEELLRVQHLSAPFTPHAAVPSQATIDALIGQPATAVAKQEPTIASNFMFGRGGPFDSVVKAFFPKSFGKKS
jgi:hypothetical protein